MPKQPFAFHPTSRNAATDRFWPVYQGYAARLETIWFRRGCDFFRFAPLSVGFSRNLVRLRGLPRNARAPAASFPAGDEGDQDAPSTAWEPFGILQSAPRGRVCGGASTGV